MTARRLRRLAADRGATAVEYGLIVGLIIVASLGAISSVQSGSEDHLTADAGRIGSQTDDAYYAGTSSTASTAATTTSTTAATVAVRPSSLVASPAATNDGNKWIANATVTVVDSGGTPRAGVLVQGSWTDPSPTTAASCTTTAPSGTCQLQRTDVQDSKSTATFVISSVTGTGVTWTPSGGDATTVVVNCPGSPSTCD